MQEIAKSRITQVFIYCVQAVLGYGAWFVVFGAAFTHALGDRSVIISLCLAVSGAILCSGFWKAFFRVGAHGLAFAYALKSIIWALFGLTSFDLTSGPELVSAVFWCSFALTLYLSGLVGGWLSRGLLPKNWGESKRGRKMGHH